jgi:hypothetical protein
MLAAGRRGPSIHRRLPDEHTPALVPRASIWSDLIVTAPRDFSCYVLELSVSPGGSRWAELHAYSDPAHIQACLAGFCRNTSGFSAYHAIWYGATLGVWVIQAGTVVDFIDVHPNIGVQLGDRAPVPLQDETTRALVVAERVKRIQAERAGKPPEEGEDDDNEDIASDDYNDVDMDIYEAMKLHLDWAAVASRLPTLAPPLLEPGDRTHVRFSAALTARGYLVDKDVIKFGSREQESGDVIDPPFKVILPPDADDADDDDWLEDHDDNDDEQDDDDDAVKH